MPAAAAATSPRLPATTPATDAHSVRRRARQPSLAAIVAWPDETGVARSVSTAAASATRTLSAAARAVAVSSSGRRRAWRKAARAKRASTPAWRAASYDGCSALRMGATPRRVASTAASPPPRPSATARTVRATWREAPTASTRAAVAACARAARTAREATRRSAGAAAPDPAAGGPRHDRARMWKRSSHTDRVRGAEAAAPPPKRHAGTAAVQSHPDGAVRRCVCTASTTARTTAGGVGHVTLPSGPPMSCRHASRSAGVSRRAATARSSITSGQLGRPPVDAWGGPGEGDAPPPSDSRGGGGDGAGAGAAPLSSTRR